MCSRWLGLVAAASLFATIRADQMPQEYDTIVIGMGAAGTVAASTLARAGRRVLALEAQDRVGGRVYTVPFDDGYVEIGAEWIHGIEDSRVYNTATENNVTILSQDLKIQIIQSNGKLAGPAVDRLIEKGFEIAEDELDPEEAEPLGNLTTKKFMEYVNKAEPTIANDANKVDEILKFLKNYVEAYESAYDWNDINALTTSVALRGPQNMSWHRDGYKTLFELLLNTYKNGPGLPSLEIKFTTEVVKIDWFVEKDKKVSVTTKDGTIYKAENVIVTTSLGVLKEKYKTLFSPSLPEKKVTAIEKLQMGLLCKIIFSFPNAWWSNKQTIYGFLWRNEDIEEVPSEDNWTTKLTAVSSPMGSTNTLTLWTSGNAAKQVEVLPEEVVKTKAIEVLRRFLGTNSTIPEPTAMLRTQWLTNEFTRGAYTYDSMIAADVPEARADLAEPLRDAAGKPRVLFAGEASHTSWFGTVHGAADTGHREAMRVLGNKTKDC